ncbi:hypothetical protein MAPG_09821 [Magnaporthiopsis poae ATCC 64411]|uniref:Uncharacterized protein n=1 Tax=Magnaporthiopsis poae (strain ATCC 64411 / 73-15) TaxID=644358 RepID=A0A0C4EAY4_MAGP6|nr:hypothetical protein MAPG_09821 [Magnaporthiopsis poae ATCC 64411]
MEDPWGSPWTAADEGTSPTAKHTAPLGLEPPPRAFLTSNAPSIGVPGLSYHSPWGHNDDNDFGAAWNSPGGGNDTATAAGSLSTWSSSWHGGDAITTPVSAAAGKERSRENSLAAKSRNGSPGKATSPGIPSPVRALSRSSSNAGLRLPSVSLDPWASEPSVGSNLERPSSPPRAPHPPAVPSPTRVPGSTANFDLGFPQWDQVDVEAIKSGPDTSEAKAETKETRGSAEAPKDSQAKEPRDRTRRSRASSACSNDGDDDDTNSRLDDTRRRQDSPITSIDEDSRARPLPKSHRSTRSVVVQRKVSSNKVKDMVVLFDGIAQRAASEPPELERGARASSAGPAVDEARPFTPPGRRPRKERRDTLSGRKPPPDTQEEDEGLAAGEDDAEEDGGRRGGRKHSVSGTPTPKMRLRASVSRGRSGSPVTSTPRPPPPRKTNFGELQTKFGPVRFVPDLAKVDLIFAKAKLGPAADVADGYVPDTILRDCFTDVSERRAAAAKRQSAPPGSPMMGLPHVVTSAGAPAPPLGMLPATASAAAPSFGWSSSPIAAPPPAPRSAVGPARPMSMFASSPLSIGPTPALPGSAGIGAKQDQVQGANLGGADDGDDDDWGEMIASPPATGNPTDPTFGTFQGWPDTADANDARKNALDPLPVMGTGAAAPESSVPTLTQPLPSPAPISTVPVAPPSGGKPAPSASLEADPWDFSFFGPADTETERQKPQGIQPPSDAISLMKDLQHEAPVPGVATPAAATQTQGQHVVSFATPVSEKTMTAPSDKTDDEDVLVRQIVQGLPDLSYMLR